VFQCKTIDAATNYAYHYVKR